ncbi:MULTISPECIES: STAS domain-containing protein [unclassified Schlesneria]|uniref:STAS domain-containing protein n=1 Tax=Schlesneria TaxID=656899 RepID=UPI002F0F3C63
MKFKIKEDRDDVVQVSIEGCLNQQDVAPPIDPIRALLGPSAYQKTVLLDMRDSSYLDSLCIGWLLSCHKRFREQGGKLVIHSLPTVAANVISLLRLNTVFQMADDSEKALQLARGEVA